MVGVKGFEPPAPCSQSTCATRLRYTPSASSPYRRRMISYPIISILSIGNHGFLKDLFCKVAKGRFRHGAGGCGQGLPGDGGAVKRFLNRRLRPAVCARWRCLPAVHRTQLTGMCRRIPAEGRINPHRCRMGAVGWQREPAQAASGSSCTDMGSYVQCLHIP